MAGTDEKGSTTMARTQHFTSAQVDLFRTDLAKATMRRARRFERAAKVAKDDTTRVMYENFARAERGTAKNIRHQVG